MFQYYFHVNSLKIYWNKITTTIGSLFSLGETFIQMLILSADRKLQSILGNNWKSSYKKKIHKQEKYFNNFETVI